MDREGENKEKMRKCREWILILSPYPHYLSISSLSLHFLFIFSFSLHFLTARLPNCHKLCSPGWLSVTLIIISRTKYMISRLLRCKLCVNCSKTYEMYIFIKIHLKFIIGRPWSYVSRLSTPGQSRLSPKLASTEKFSASKTEIRQRKQSHHTK